LKGQSLNNQYAEEKIKKDKEKCKRDDFTKAKAYLDKLLKTSPKHRINIIDII
jgi:hypothetical protein